MGKYYRGGRLRSADTIRISGYRTLTGASPEELWSGTATVRPTPAGEQVKIISTSANDAAAGTGCRTVRIDYLDANGIRQNETIATNGLTAVASVATDVGALLGVTCMTFGSGNASAGTISITNAAATTTFEQQPAFEHVAPSASYTVPVGNVLYITRVDASASVAGAEIGIASDTNPANGTSSPSKMWGWGRFLTSTPVHTLNPAVPIGPFPAGSKVWITGKDAAATVVMATVEGYLEPA